MQLEVSATLMQVKISAAYIWVTIFIEIMQVGVSVTIIQVVLSTVHLCTHDYFYCNYADDCMTASSSNFILFSLTSIFHKIDQKTFKGIVSSLYFTTLINIPSKIKILYG